MIHHKSLLTLLCLCLTHAATAFAQPRLQANNIDEVVNAMTLEEKCHLVLGCGMAFGPEAKFPGTAGSTYAIPRLGIPATYCADSNQGLRMAAKRDFDSRDYFCTDYMTSIALASTWDRQAAYTIGKGIGNETREYGLDWILAPSMNLMRNVLCGRNHEYYSEDPFLSGIIAAYCVKGIQSEGTAACIKHFAANNQETNRNANDSRMSLRALRELYLRGFEWAVRMGKPRTIMTAYNSINGQPTCEDPALTETILRGEWGFDGMVVSDWNAGKSATAAIIAGNDMLQPGQERQFNELMADAKSGKLPLSSLNRSVKRILQYVIKSHNFAQYAYTNDPQLKQHADDVRKIGAECMVLLKNDAALPLPAAANVALFGCTSYDIISGGTGFGGTAVGRYTVSLVEGLRNAGYNVYKPLLNKYKAHLDAERKRLYPNGLPPFSLKPLDRAEEMDISAEEMQQAIDQTQCAIITIGRKSGEAVDRTQADFNLYPKEQALIKQVSEAYRKVGKHVVVLLNVCSPVETASWKTLADAVVCTWQTGEQVGNSIADVLSGNVNPSAKLPVTFQNAYGDAAADSNFPSNVTDIKDLATMFMWGNNEQNAKRQPERNIDFTNYDEDIYVGYRYFCSFNKPVSFPFGFGLSYTSFAYRNAKLTTKGDTYTLSVEVTNTGSRAGRNVVQLYVAAPRSKQLNKPEKELRDFAKTSLLLPGQSETITLSVSAAHLASFDSKASAWRTDAGDYQFLVCSSADKVEAKCTARVKAQMRKVDNVMKPQVRLQLLSR